MNEQQRAKFERMLKAVEDCAVELYEQPPYMEKRPIETLKLNLQTARRLLRLYVEGLESKAH
jgi:hypothetical protein